MKIDFIINVYLCGVLESICWLTIEYAIFIVLNY